MDQSALSCWDMEWQYYSMAFHHTDNIFRNIFNHVIPDSEMLDSCKGTSWLPQILISCQKMTYMMSFKINFLISLEMSSLLTLEDQLEAPFNHLNALKTRKELGLDALIVSWSNSPK